MSQLRDMGLYLPWGVLLCYGIELGKSILVWFDQSDRSIWRIGTNETGLVHSVDNVRPAILVCSPVQLWLAKELWECLPAVSAGNLRVNPDGRNVNKAFSQIDLSFPWLRLGWTGQLLFQKIFLSGGRRLPSNSWGPVYCFSFPWLQINQSCVTKRLLVLSDHVTIVFCFAWWSQEIVMKMTNQKRSAWCLGLKFLLSILYKFTQKIIIIKFPSIIIISV